MIYRIFIFSALLLSISCSSDDDTSIPNQEEEITTLTYTLVYKSDTVEFISNDTDGEGGNDAIITIKGTLKSNTTYNGIVKVENTMDTLSIIDITEEVQEEADEHQFFYQENINDLTISYNNDDVDENGNPIGIKTILTTGNAGSGSLTITLIHQPNKTAEGIQINNMDNVGGSTDVQATFNVEINDR